MKYNDFIKKTKDINEQIDMYLAYLKDDGFKVNYDDLDNSIMICKENYFEWRNTKGANVDDFYFTWDDISDYIIPYLHILGETYDYTINLKQLELQRDKRSKNNNLSIENIENNNLSNFKTETIFINISDKKSLNKLQKFGNFLKNKVMK